MIKEIQATCPTKFKFEHDNWNWFGDAYYFFEILDVNQFVNQKHLLAHLKTYPPLDFYGGLYLLKT